MRRLHRCLFICHRALAPLLFLTIAGLWLASYHFAFDIFRCNPFVRISIGQGTIDISRNNRPVNQNVFSEEFLSKWHIARSNGFASLVDNFARSSLEFAGAAEATQSMLGFSHTYSKGPNNQWYDLTEMRIWHLLVLPLLLLASPIRQWIKTRRGVRRTRAGQCPTRGYDIRATPHQCPECGTFKSPVPNQ